MRNLRILGAIALVGLFGVYGLSQGCDEGPGPAPAAGPPLDAAGAAAARTCGEVSCRTGQRCAVACEGGSAGARCEDDPGTGKGLGEACDGDNRCRVGVCVGANLRGPSQQCLAFCTETADCVLGQACEVTSLTYYCEGGKSAPVAVKLCRWK